METKTANKEQLVGTKSSDIRNGWAAAFTKYVEEGEDEMFPTYRIDNELEFKLDKSCMENPIKQQLDDILLTVSWREVSNQYFGKSSAWLYQKLDGVDDKGNPCELTQAEQESLKQALYDLATVSVVQRTRYND